MKTNTSNIMAEFKARQNLVSKDMCLNHKERFEKSINTGTENKKYNMYKAKLESGNFDKFSNQDILYFFVDVAKENGVTYIVANPQKEMRQFKLCQERGMSKEEILSIIEFVFTSGQTYLDINKFHPGILVSRWINTLKRDTSLWLEDKFDPKAKNNKKTTKREWQEETPEQEQAEVGEWGF